MDNCLLVQALLLNTRSCLKGRWYFGAWTRRLKLTIVNNAHSRLTVSLTGQHTWQVWSIEASVNLDDGTLATSVTTRHGIIATSTNTAEQRSIETNWLTRAGYRTHSLTGILGGGMTYDRHGASHVYSTVSSGDDGKLFDFYSVLMVMSGADFRENSLFGLFIFFPRLFGSQRFHSRLCSSTFGSLWLLLLFYCFFVVLRSNSIS